MADVTIRAILFDVGGVLLRTFDRNPRDSLERAYGLSPGEAMELVYTGEIGQSAQRGDITASELWRSIGVELGLTSNGIREFKQQFMSGDWIDPDLISFVRNARNTYKTAIISNYADDLFNWLHNTYSVTDAFDVITVSGVEGIMKPDPQIFQLTLDQLDVAPEEAVFIDDVLDNLGGAIDLGISGIHFTPELDWKAAFAKLGVQPQ